MPLFYIVREKNTYFLCRQFPISHDYKGKNSWRRERENNEEKNLILDIREGQTKFTLLWKQANMYGEVAKAKWNGAGNISCTFLLEVQNNSNNNGSNSRTNEARV